MRGYVGGIPIELSDLHEFILEMNSEEAGCLRRCLDKCVDQLPDGHTLTIKLPAAAQERKRVPEKK